MHPPPLSCRIKKQFASPPFLLLNLKFQIKIPFTGLEFLAFFLFPVPQLFETLRQRVACLSRQTNHPPFQSLLFFRVLLFLNLKFQI